MYKSFVLSTHMYFIFASLFIIKQMEIGKGISLISKIMDLVWII